MAAYMLRLGALGFGGPVALVGYTQRDVVEARQWISQEDSKERLTLAQLAQGPLAAQLGIYMGYVHYRILRATLAGLSVCSAVVPDGGRAFDVRALLPFHRHPGTAL